MLFDITFYHWLIILSAALSLSGAYTYIRDIFRGKTKPNLVSWGLWSVAALIATGAAISANADGWATVRIFVAGFTPLLISIAALMAPQSYWKLTKFDFACGALSVVALGFWLLAGQPILAILLAAIADLFALIPTITKAWKHPETETLSTWFIGLFTASIVLPAIPVWNIENAAFQVYLLIANVIVFTIVLRGRIKKRALTI